MENSYTWQWMAGAFLAVALVTALVVRRRSSRPTGPWLRRLDVLLETALVLTALAAAYAWPTLLPRKVADIHDLDWVGMLTSIPDALGYLLLVIVVLCFFWIRNRTAFLAAAIILPTTAYCCLLYVKFVPVLEDINAKDIVEIFGPRVSLSVLFPGAREMVSGIAAVLGGLYFCRWGFAPWKYLCGAFVGAFVIEYATHIFIYPGIHSLLIQTLLLALVARLLIALPHARQRLEHLSGISLSQTSELAGAPRYTLLQRLIAHGGLTLIAIVVATSAMYSYTERQTVRMLLDKPLPVYRSKSLHNAVSEIVPAFAKSGAPSLNRKPFAEPVDRIRTVHSDMADIRDDEYWQKLDAAQLYSDFKQLDYFISRYRKAAEMDYLELGASYTEPRGMYNYLHVREISRAMSVHAQLLIRDGRTTEALNDIRSIIRFGALFTDQPVLVSQMVGSAVRRIGISVATDYYLLHRNDPDKLRQLHAMLAELAPYARESFDIDALRRGEPATLPVVIMAEYLVPAMRRASEGMGAGVVNFEMLRIATALELYRADHGNYPLQLDDLLPDYLPLLPREPFEGDPLTYRITADGFELSTPNQPETVKDLLDSYPPRPLDEVVKDYQEDVKEKRTSGTTTASSLP